MDTDTLPIPTDADDPMLRLAVAAHLARYKGQGRAHTASDLNLYLRWCLEKNLERLQAQCAHVELYLRWLQEVRRLRPSTVSRRLSVLATFYRTCVIDQILEHSPAEYVRRPHVPLESPTLGLSHLQFEAILTAGRDSTNSSDFALVAMLGLLGLRVFEATGANVQALGEARGHRVLTVHGKGDKTALLPLHRLSVVPSTRRSPVALPDRSSSTATPGGWIVTRPPAACKHLPSRPTSRRPACTHTCCATHS